MQRPPFDFDACRSVWRECLAPGTGDVRAQLIHEASDFYGLTTQEVADRLHNAVDQFTAEWRERRVDSRDSASLVRFYNETKAEVFDLLQWHATNDIHVRSVMCAELARRAPGREVLDYGSGIGSDAIVFSRMGFNVTIADVSEPLLAFARYRCERHGLKVQTIDLKREAPRKQGYDVELCFDVLEHIPQPVAAVKQLRDALRPGGLLFLHAPFGQDPDRPMHVVHEDVVSPNAGTEFSFPLRSGGTVPARPVAPQVYERVTPKALDRLGYRLQDLYLPPWASAPLAAAYRAVVPKR